MDNKVRCFLRYKGLNDQLSSEDFPVALRFYSVPRPKDLVEIDDTEFVVFEVIRQPPKIPVVKLFKLERSSVYD